MLSTWIQDQNKRHISVSMLSVYTKARCIYEDLSRGDDNVCKCRLVNRFINSFNFCNITMSGEAASADTVVVIHYKG
jgi:hypothetical protein